ncbi:DUF4402 domain-containing protein [Caulobacter sp. 17J80-11]|uniref:DUF4402 domain-containing protein n=1 Tax=Caulobacter sp. 17J80-11 TaxID=2763502 RepID=UPI001653BD91|nr:DUF4402 domain-containing protein [Caulobacter sp. 17J80-11]MBC6981961.1 DUF4402 domain-containing protein [Caulobacter sp. 17J80-11]
MKLLITCGVAAVALAAASSAFAETGNGSVTVIRPLTVTKNDDLAFGTVVRPTSGSGSVGVSTAGVASYSGGVANVTSGGGQAPARFTIDGEGGQAISVSVDPTFTISGSAGNLTVTTTNDFDSLPLSGSLGGSGSKTVKVGGSVPITSTTGTGAYTGAFNVTASYN